MILTVNQTPILLYSFANNVLLINILLNIVFPFIHKNNYYYHCQFYFEFQI